MPSYWEQIDIAERVANSLRIMRLDDERACLGAAIRRVAGQVGLRLEVVELCVEAAS